MRFQRQIKPQHGLHGINIIPLINVVFLLLIFCVLTSMLTSPLGIHVFLPKAITSDIIKDENLVITITSENVIYFNNALVTIKELKAILSKTNNHKRSVLIKADRRTSAGRIVDVWDLCRILGIERINIATNQGP